MYNNEVIPRNRHGRRRHAGCYRTCTPFTKRRYPSDRYTHRLGKDVTYCFIEIRDEAGRGTWTNPMFFSE